MKRTPLAAAPALALLAACSLPAPSGQTPSSEPSTGSSAPQSSSALAGLTVAEEHTGNYDRDNWPHWRTEDGCDTRERILISQGNGVVTDDDCDVQSGTWTSPYDGQTWTDSSDVDIDHMVPLAEAAQSGGHAWPEAKRTRFANDERFLLVVTDNVNQTKGAEDPAEWLPAQGVCDYVELWIETKTAYDLTVDPAEKQVLANELQECR